MVLSGANWQVENLSVSEWGTDCILITNSGELKNCIISYGRRNNVSVVLSVLVVPFIKVSIDNCVFENGGDWADDLRNRPGGGVVVEAGKLDAPACVEVSNSHFQGNYLKDIQLSKGALNCSCLLYTSPSPRDKRQSRMPSSA